MAQTLYRKYRPLQFADLVNQEHIKQTLKNALKTGSIAHAYLFSGSRGIGKTTVARIFAKSLNCEKLDKQAGEACTECTPCVAFQRGTLLDVLEIDAASYTGVDTIRETIIETARLLPSVGTYKVFIIDEVHMLSTSAFNALLKIIEEPPAHVVFIFATTESMKVPVTIISRCQRFDFKKLSSEDIIERLKMIVKKEKRSVENAVLESIAKHSDGALRDAESLLGQVLTLHDEKITLKHASLLLPISHIEKVRELATMIVDKETGKAIDFLLKLVQDGVDLDQFAHDLLELWRSALLRKVNSSIEILDSQNETWVSGILSLLKLSEIELFIELNIKAIRDGVQEKDIVTLPIEMMIVAATTRE